ncbi:MAG: PTS sugar transporter subunit IIC [Christensenellales bacterium]
MRKITLWLIASAAIMLALPWLAVTFIKGDGGMAACLVLFFALNPIYAVFTGIYAGRDIKRLWALPTITALFFLAGSWLFFDMGEKAFVLYASVYLFLGAAAMLISVFVKKKHSEVSKIKAYFKAQNIEFSAKRIFIDGLGGMAYGLFASLLIGTIISTVGTYLFDLRFTLWGNEYSLFADANGFAKVVQGAAMAAAIGYAMKAPAFVLYSLLAVGYAANALGGSGGPLSVFFVSIVSIFFGKLVSKRTPVDLIVTPAVTILTGVLAAMLIAPPIGEIGTVIGNFIMWATEMRPFVMGLLVSAVMGAVLTLPISSAAICAAFGLTGLAGGACVAGCCAHMVGFAVASWRENRFQGLAAQGLGTSMLQVPNLMRKPVLWLPAVAASLVGGPLATCVFRLEQNGFAIASGMGTCGLVGPIGVIVGWVNGDGATAWDIVGLILVAVVVPALVSWAVSELMRRRGLIKPGDYKLDL